MVGDRNGTTSHGARSKFTLRAVLLCLIAIFLFLPSGTVRAQDLDLPDAALERAPSPKRAFALSLLLPGLGHRHAAGGEWTTWGGAFAIADLGLWASLFGGEWRHDQLVQGYRTLASTSAHAEIAGKDRSFFLNLASYESSADFREAMLQTRQWDRIDYAERPGYAWSWDSTDEFRRYRSLREDAESLRRRRAVIAASLVANRIISGIIAARGASVRRRGLVTARLGVPVGSRPTIEMTYRF